jgi:hypothetical protein
VDLRRNIPRHRGLFYDGGPMGMEKEY